MKKLFIVLLALLCVCNICACNNNEKEKLLKEYDKDYELLMDDINELSECCKFVSGDILEVWYVVGVDNLATSFEIMMTIESAEALGKTPDTRVFAGDMYDIFGYDLSDMSIYETVMDYGMRTGYYQDVFDYCVVFREKYKEMVTLDESIEKKIKNFKDKYTGLDEKEMDAIIDYYLKVNSFVDFSLEPSGSLLDYSSDIQSYEKDLSELKTKAELNK